MKNLQEVLDNWRDHIEPESFRESIRFDNGTMLPWK